MGGRPVGELLYLDTARLGRMTAGSTAGPSRAFTELAGEEGGSAYFERFLRTEDSIPSPAVCQGRYRGAGRVAGRRPR
jgi:hypothetical protein